MITTKPFFHAPYGSVLLTSNMVFYYFLNSAALFLVRRFCV